MSIVDRDIAINRGRLTRTDLSYPSKPSVHNIVLNFSQYDFKRVPGASRIGASRGSLRTETAKRSIASIVLPLPTNLEDTYSVKVGETELNSTGAASAEFASERGFRGILDPDVLESINERSGASLKGDAISSYRAYSRFVSSNFMDTIPGVGTGIDVGAGRAVNPHIALNFDGVSLKTHNFSWTLSPSNEEEARRIRDIINTIRRESSPKYSFKEEIGGGVIGRALLSYPSMCDVFFVGINQSYWYYFKPTLISSVNVNYAPNGVAMNKGGKPAIVQLSVSMTEAEIHTREDYE